MSLTTEFDETQLGAARATAWKQTGEPVLTLEAARDWINERGLVLFAPRAQQLPMPAPSLVEATLGGANAAPTMAETEVARGLVSRLVGEGLALPLNLMGVPGDSPDFVVSAQVFSYVFTMRGDKAWKLPPSTTGAVKVSPLGLRVFEVLTERGPMSASELAQELGREVTEAAILRSLSELWSQLRVLPLLQQGDGVTLWELTSRRFTKAIKAGANAGQPTALSALISLYLAQVFMATEEDVMTFLSPLTARSRVRDVLHALMGARQLETIVLEGKTLLHIPGTVPVAAAIEAAEGAETEGEPAAMAERPKKIGTGRIKSFASAEKTASEFRGKPAARSLSAGRAGAGRSGSGRAGAGPVKPSARYGARLDGKTDPERRPFKRSAGEAGAGEKRTFTKPWNEDRNARPAGRTAAAPKADGFTKFRRPEPEDREPLGPREQAGLPEARRSVPKSSFDRVSKPGGFTKRPYTPRGAENGERGTFKPRSFEGKGQNSKPGGFGTKRPYAPRAAEGGEAGFPKRAYTPRPAEDGERKTFKPRSFEGKDRGTKPGGFGAKRPFAPRNSEGSASGFTKRPSTPRTSSAGGERTFTKRPYAPRAVESAAPDEGGGVQRTLPKRPYKPRAADADKRVFTKTPWEPKPEGDGGKRPYKARGEGGAGRAGAGPRKSFGGRSGGKFGSKPGGFGGKKDGPSGGPRRG
ncbi:MAG: hypothetical protein HIU91_04810 [Acidobacteria bacterium]|nr:hypothetical protein [Acidobacteriota bacterium]